MPPDEPQGFPVGSQMRRYEDPSRPNWFGQGSRPLVSLIWYPAAEGTREKNQHIAVFRTGRYARNAAFSKRREKFPLVLVSHGTGGSAATMAWFCADLARQGFVVAAVNHHGNTGAEPRRLMEGFVLWWERPKDLSSLLDCLLGDPEFGPRVDAERVGVAGFSLGGYTALASVGMRVDPRRWKPYCDEHPDDPLCRLPPEAGEVEGDLWDLLMKNPRIQAGLEADQQVVADPRFRASFAMAPVGGAMVLTESLREISVPVHIVAGERDDQSVAESCAIPFSQGIPDCGLDLLPRVRHYTFLCRGTVLGRLRIPFLFRDGFGVSRKRVHDQTSRKAVAFFRSALA